MRFGAVLVILALLLCRAAWRLTLRRRSSPVPGAEAASGYCNACHTSDYIVMNSMFLSAAAWQAEVTKMRTAFGAQIEDSAAAEIAAYLAAKYAVPAKP